MSLPWVAKKVSVPIFALCIAVAAFAQMRMSVEQLREFIQSSIKLHQEDKQVADYLKKVKLTERLDDRAVEELQGMGAGPRTVAALRELSAESAKLPAPAPPPPKVVYVPPPPPSSEEQARILAEVRENALNYSNRLPDFICLQVTRRYVDPYGQDAWYLMDTIDERLSFFEHHEDYKVVTVNNRVVNVSHFQLGGATSSGEFGSMLEEIFQPATQTEFGWDHWATLRGRRNYAFSFHVDQAHSKYSIYHEPSKMRIVTGYHGLVYVDCDTLRVMRIKLQADTLPPSFPIQEVTLDLNYDYQKIGDTQFVLPLKAELRSREGQYHIKNDVEFRMYRKFSADATITFDQTPEPLPADQTQEEPVKPDKVPPPPPPPVKKP